MSFLALVVFLLFAVELNAATYWVTPAGTMSGCTASATVPSSNSGYKSTINAGIGCLAAGDTLYVRAGTYNERIAPNIPASAGSPVLISNYNNETVTITSTSCSDFIAMFSSYLTVHGINANATNCNGVSFNVVTLGGTGTTNQTFENAEVYNCPDSCIQVNRNNAGPIWVRNNLLHDANGTGSPVAAASYGIYNEGVGVIIENNTIYSNTGYGIHNYGSLTPFPSNTTIRYNEVYGNCTNLKLASYAGILLGPGDNNVAYANIVRDNFCHGIQVSLGATNAKVYNNTSVRNQEGGIDLESNQTGTTVRNNIMAGNREAFVGINTATHSNNLCAVAETGCDLVEATGSTFTNFAGNIFSLNSTSAAINAGYNLGNDYNMDYAGISRPQGIGFDIGAYEYQAGPPSQPRLVLALPLDTGSGDVITDISGLGNDGLFGAGVSWDNSGKYGKALSFDGTAAAVIPHSASLDLSSMTIEAWVYPTSQFTIFKAVAVKNYTYYLYAYAEPGVCSTQQTALAGFGGVVNSFVCDVNILPVNTWSHLAVTFDGTTLSYYRDGAVVSTSLPGQLMVSGNGTLQIGGSQFGEYFQGKIDEVRIYNYARTQAQIQFDMNTPLMAAPGAVAGITISADKSITLCASCSIKVQAQ